LEEAKKVGKFKPIGFKPIGAGDNKGKKRKKGEGERERKKKRTDGGDDEKNENGTRVVESARKGNEMLPPPDAMVPTPVMKHKEVAQPEPPEPELDPDLDIFAGAGEYEGIDIDDEDDEGEGGEEKQMSESEPGIFPVQPVQARWFAPEDGEQPQQQPPSELGNNRSDTKFRSPPHAEEEEGHEPAMPTRLVPLESSALPSIKDLLAMDAAQDNKKKYKGKKKGADDGGVKEKKMSAEVKADRDYKRSVLSVAGNCGDNLRVAAQAEVIHGKESRGVKYQTMTTFT
jgi:IK cytokine